MANIINKDSFNKDVLESRGYVYVDFYADWCGPCKMMGPIMDEIGNEHSVYKVNVDQEGELASQFSIMSIPCVILFKDGKEYARSIGLKSKEDILKMMN